MTNSGVNGLTEAANVAAHSGHHKLAGTVGNFPLKHFFQGFFGRSVAFALAAQTIGKQEMDAGVAGGGDAADIGKDAVNRRKIKFKIAAVVNGTGGSFNN